MKDTHIEWATHTLNEWEGCTKVSEACERCYAEKPLRYKRAITIVRCTTGDAFKLIEWLKAHCKLNQNKENN